MVKTAFLLGGTGQIGRAAALRLIAAEWDVVLASRGEWPIANELRELQHVQLDREDTDALRKALGNGVDVLVDAVAFEQQHAEQLLSISDLVRSLIVISSGSVYVDNQGRSLDQATNADEFPDFQGPIVDMQATIPPADNSYSTKKVAIEETLLEQDRTPVTIVRPFAIYGPGAPFSREWYFVKRALDGRRFVLLGDRGRNRSQTTSTENLAELILLAAERPRTGVFNCGDPDPPCVLEIARAIGDAMDHDWTEVLFEWAEPWQRGVERVGDTPWSAPKPRVADMTLTEIEFGYRPVTTYQEAVRATCEWLVYATRGQDWRTVLTVSSKVMADAFDYEAEDAFVRGLTAMRFGRVAGR